MKRPLLVAALLAAVALPMGQASAHDAAHFAAGEPGNPKQKARVVVVTMKEGDAIHMPYMWPHWIRTGGRPSISMAMTWKTPEVLRLNKIRLMNGTLRRFGLAQKPPGVSPAIDATKVFAHDAMRAVIDPLRKSEKIRRLLRGLIYGRKANYYYETKIRRAGM